MHGKTLVLASCLSAANAAGRGLTRAEARFPTDTNIRALKSNSTKKRCKCAVNCGFDEWNPWSTCTAICDGTRNRTRTKASEAKYGGKACPTNAADPDWFQEETCNSPCENGATCTDLIGNYSCACAVGWHGRNCTESNVCTCSSGHGTPANGTACTNDGANICGTCDSGYELNSTKECECPAGLSGPECKICSGAEFCNSQGTCDGSTGTAKCTCDVGWTGTNCADVDHCVGNNCERGMCINDAATNGYRCDCAGTGYEGATCNSKLSCLLNQNKDHRSCLPLHELCFTGCPESGPTPESFEDQFGTSTYKMDATLEGGASCVKPDGEPSMVNLDGVSLVNDVGTKIPGISGPFIKLSPVQIGGEITIGAWIRVDAPLADASTGKCPGGVTPVSGRCPARTRIFNFHEPSVDLSGVHLWCDQISMRQWSDASFPYGHSVSGHCTSTPHGTSIGPSISAYTVKTLTEFDTWFSHPESSDPDRRSVWNFLALVFKIEGTSWNGSPIVRIESYRNNMGVLGKPYIYGQGYHTLPPVLERTYVQLGKADFDSWNRHTFDGAFRSFKVWSRGLHPDEIADIYEKGRGENPEYCS